MVGKFQRKAQKEDGEPKHTIGMCEDYACLSPPTPVYFLLYSWGSLLWGLRKSPLAALAGRLLASLQLMRVAPKLYPCEPPLNLMEVYQIEEGQYWFHVMDSLV